MLVLVMGYFLTTGIEIIDSTIAKTVFRVIVGALALFNIFLGRTIRPIYIFGAIMLVLMLMLNQNVIAGNMIFLLILVASMERSTEKDTALAFFIPCALVVSVHLIFLTTGTITQQFTTFDGRTRSLLGFVNPNQLSIVYLSLAFTAIYLHLQFRSFKSMMALFLALLIVLPVVAQSGSRTSLFSLGLVVLSYPIWFLFLKVKHLRSIIGYLGSFAPITAAIISFYLAQNTNPSLNMSLSLRPEFFHLFLSHATFIDLVFGWSPAMGQPIDNAFLLLLSVVGAPFFVAIIIYISIAFMRLESIYLPLAFMMIFSSIFESFLLRPEIPLSSLFLLLIIRKPKPQGIQEQRHSEILRQQHSAQGYQRKHT